MDSWLVVRAFSPKSVEFKCEGVYGVVMGGVAREERRGNEGRGTLDDGRWEVGSEQREDGEDGEGRKGWKVARWRE